MEAIERPPWPVRRLFPLLATVVMAAVGMAGTIWGPRYYGKTAWALPDDLWGTLIAAQRLAHLNLAGLYTSPTQLVSLPGTAVILVPAILVIDLTGLRLGLPSAHGPYPGVWLFTGPYQVAISAVTLFAADAIAERLGASQAQAFLARRRERHGPVERHYPVGPPGGRRGDRAAAVRRPGAGRLEDQPVRVAGRGGGGRAAARAARVPAAGRRGRAEEAGRLHRPGGCPGRRCCWPPRPRPTGRPPSTR